MASRSDDPTPALVAAADAAGPDPDLAIIGGAGNASDRAEVIRLSPEDTLRFVEALLSPPEPTPAMVRAFEHHRRLFCGS